MHQRITDGTNDSELGRNISIDWSAIKAQFQAHYPVREIARIHGVSHSAINRRSKAEGWKRDDARQARGKALPPSTSYVDMREHQGDSPEDYEIRHRKMLADVRALWRRVCGMLGSQLNNRTISTAGASLILKQITDSLGAIVTLEGKLFGKRDDDEGDLLTILRSMKRVERPAEAEANPSTKDGNGSTKPG
jgi:hypothetical protein